MGEQFVCKFVVRIHINLLTCPNHAGQGDGDGNLNRSNMATSNKYIYSVPVQSKSNYCILILLVVSSRMSRLCILNEYLKIIVTCTES